VISRKTNDGTEAQAREALKRVYDHEFGEGGWIDNDRFYRELLQGFTSALQSSSNYAAGVGDAVDITQRAARAWNAAGKGNSGHLVHQLKMLHYAEAANEIVTALESA